MVVTSKLDELQRQYAMPEREKVLAFLSARPGVVDFLLEARPHIELQFGRDAPVELLFPRDYGHDDLRDLLFATVYADLDVHDSEQRLNRVWDEWLGDASAKPESGSVVFGVEHPDGRRE